MIKFHAAKMKQAGKVRKVGLLLNMVDLLQTRNQLLSIAL